MQQKNIKGEYGFVNIDGKYGSPSSMAKVGDADFWSYIEDGIKPVVEVLIKYNIETFGSCQGHYVPGKPILDANVRYYTDNLKVARIMQHSVELFNHTNIVCAEAPAIMDNGALRKTDRITFAISPKHREELSTLVLEYTRFLDEYLAKYLKSSKDTGA